MYCLFHQGKTSKISKSQSKTLRASTVWESRHNTPMEYIIKSNSGGGGVIVIWLDKPLLANHQPRQSNGSSLGCFASNAKYLGRQQRMTQELGSLPPMWKTLLEFWALGGVTAWSATHSVFLCFHIKHLKCQAVTALIGVRDAFSRGSRLEKVKVV